jgi:hypothetical protein
MKYRSPGINGFMGDEELAWLYEKAKEMRTIVEIGSWLGKSTHALLSGCKGTVYAIDHFKGSESEIDDAHASAKTEDIKAMFLENVGYFKNLVVIEEDSSLASKRFEDHSIDMIFIDGDHSYKFVKKDFDFWFPKCSRLFCGHDKDQDGVPKALEELGKPFFNPVNTIWCIPLFLI